LCIVSFCSVSFEFISHGGRRGNTVQALGRWWHPEASIEVRDVLHWVMHPVLYRCIAMAIEIASDSPAFFVAGDSLSPTTIANSYSRND